MSLPFKILVFAFLVKMSGCCDMDCKRQEYAEMIIKKVEEYKVVNRGLPRDVTEIGLIEHEEGPAYYQLETDSTYIVWYGLGLGDSKTYYSETQSWR